MSVDILQNYPIPDYAHEKLMRLFRKYLVIGGMPEIVQSYAEHEDLVRLEPVYQSLIASYMDDVEKYSSGTQQTSVIRHLISSSFPFACERIKFEGFGKSSYKSRDVGDGFRMLEKTMLLHLVYPVAKPRIPIVPNLRKSPKLHLVDTGLVSFSAQIQAELLIS